MTCTAPITRKDAIDGVARMLLHYSAGNYSVEGFHGAVVTARMQLFSLIASGKVCRDCAIVLVTALADLVEWTISPEDNRPVETLYEQAPAVPDFVPAEWTTA